MENLLQDIRFGLRGLLKQPGFSLLVVATLALGIGASTAIFSVVNSVLLNKLPYRDASRIVAIQELDPKGSRIQITSANFLDWKSQNSVFQQLAALRIDAGNLALGDRALRLNMAVTSANFFDVFGVGPQLGRLFVPADEQAGHPPVVVISYNLWQGQFGGQADVIGKNLVIDGTSYSIIGVAPKGFQYPDKTELWLP